LNYIKILGASGSKAKGHNTTSFQVFKDIVVDAGNIINALGDEAQYINHIFITHSHADHISDLPFVIESFFSKRTQPLIIYGLEETINVLKEHSFNNKVWPDFTKINLPNTNEPSLILKTITLEEEIILDEYSIKAIDANHIECSCGYLIKKSNKSFIISGDTYLNKKLIDIINEDRTIKSLLIECSFPNELEQLANLTKHLTPKLIKQKLKDLKRNDLSIFYYHLKPVYEKQLKKEIKELGLLNFNGKILKEGDLIHVDSGKIEHDLISEDKLSEIMKINLMFSSEHNKNKLLDSILTLIRKFTNAEAGTLYITSKDEQKLDFKVVQNDKLNIKLGGLNKKLQWPSLPIYLDNGEINNSMVAVMSYHQKKIINIPNAYNNKKYNFEGTRNFDNKTGYKSESMLVIPLINHENDVIGVLQLINKKVGNKTKEFNKFDEKVLKSLASQAAMALTNTQLIIGLEDLLNSFVTTIAKAIDAKSPYTSEHIQKVEKIAILLAKAIDKDDTIYKNINYSKNDYKQIALAAWMHDIGKISMPEHIIDKSTKLEKIFDRIEVIEQRLKIEQKNKEIEYLKNLITQDEFEEFSTMIEEYISFLKRINIGAEFMDTKDEAKLFEIYEKNFLTQDEFYNLSIKKGTLTKEEKDIINNHAQLSLDMISELPFPKKYKDVLNIACNHHEKLDGTGYPRGLSEKEISLEDRIMILADIFEALTANNRPYKEAMKLSKVKDILFTLANKGEIDKELIEFFFNNEILKKYSKDELDKKQIDIEL
jgi:HD-GYP domain-containing protein (c-di-GMP phosphodiesterase class II)/ribonuclease BN (tRNA processing enzyme)